MIQLQSPSKSKAGARRPTTRFAVAVIVAATAVPASLSTQVPPDHALVGTLQDSAALGAPGLFYVSLADGKVTEVTGLPATFNATTPYGGIGALTLRKGNGDVFLGNRGTGQANTAIEISKIELSGNAVRGTPVRLPLGHVSSGWTLGSFLLQMMPDDRRLLVGVPSSLHSGPMAGYQLGIVDMYATPPRVTPVRLQSALQGPFLFRAAVANDGRTAYVTTHTGNQNITPVRLYRVDLQTGDTCLLYTEPTRVLALADRIVGDVIYATNMDLYSSPQQPTDLLTIRTTRGNCAVKVSRRPLNGPEVVAGGPLDLARGRMVLLAGPWWQSSPNTIFTTDLNGNRKVLAKPPANGWGQPSNIEVDGTLEDYGATPHERDVGFRTLPNPGGVAFAGNTGFTLTLEATTALDGPALLLLGTSRVDWPVFGTRILANPMFAIPVLPPKPTTIVLLPLPRATANAVIYAQWIRCQGLACQASRGMRIRIR